MKSNWFGGGWGGWKGDEMKKHGCEKINQWTENKITEKFTKQMMGAKWLMHYVEPRLKEAERIFHKELSLSIGQFKYL